MLKPVLLALATVATIAFAQDQPAPAPAAPAAAKLEILDVEATVPVSPSSYPGFPLGYDSEIEVPLAATDAAGNGVPGVTVTWTVQNTGKAPVYVIAKTDAGQSARVRGVVQPGQTYDVTSVTGGDGRTSITLNANAVAQAKITAKAGALTAKNLRDATHQVDWMK